MRQGRPGVRGWEIAAFAVSFALAACVGLALLWAGPATYREIASERDGRSELLRPDRPGERTDISTEGLTLLHEGWLAYVTGRTGTQPAQGEPWFTEDERRHMSDVRTVFVAAQVLAAGAAAALVVLARRAARRGQLPRLARAGAVAAALGVGAIGAVAAVAFDAAFLLFHEVVFPQGNFLFPPGSNLLVIYPEPYWYGVTLRIALSFLAVAALVALAGHLALRRTRAR